LNYLQNTFASVKISKNQVKSINQKTKKP